MHKTLHSQYNDERTPSILITNNNHQNPTI